MQSKQSIDLLNTGHALSKISGYLTQGERLALASTSKDLRELMLTNDCWPTFEIYDRFHTEKQNWKYFLRWVSKYIKIIKPSSVILSIFQINYEPELLKMFMEGAIESVEKLDIYFESEDIHLAISLCFPNLTEIVLRSQCASDQLVSFMFQNLKRITCLVIIKNDMSFTCSKLSAYSQNPLEKLQLKPYLLDFEEIKAITQKSAYTLRQLEIDVEECENQMIVEIISPLKSLQKLRLYHLENLYTDKQLIQILESTENLLELTVTKAYNFRLSQVISSFKSPSLLSLDITDSRYFEDEDLILLSKNSPNLKKLNISWCNSITCSGLKVLIENCTLLENLDITGIKESKDEIFTDYIYLLKEISNEKIIDIRKSIHQAHQTLDSIQSSKQKHQRLISIEEQFDIEHQIFGRKLADDRMKIKSLRNLKLLDCRSCNGVSDLILYCIYLINRKVKAYNYYGNQMSLFGYEIEDEYY